eukprot:scaffold1918_cov227-Chaetoceros_neogracile.AAC.3
MTNFLAVKNKIDQHFSGKSENKCERWPVAVFIPNSLKVTTQARTDYDVDFLQLRIPIDGLKCWRFDVAF